MFKSTNNIVPATEYGLLNPICHGGGLPGPPILIVELLLIAPIFS